MCTYSQRRTGLNVLLAVCCAVLWSGLIIENMAQTLPGGGSTTSTIIFISQSLSVVLLAWKPLVEWCVFGYLLIYIYSVYPCKYTEACVHTALKTNPCTSVILGYSIIPSETLHYYPQHHSISQAYVALGSLRWVLWGLRKVHEVNASCTMCFAGFSLHSNVSFLFSPVSLLLQTEASDRDISPAPLGKEAAGGRGGGGTVVVDFLQQIGKRWGGEASEAWRMEVDIFRFPSSPLKKTEGSRGDVRLCMVPLLPLPSPAVRLPFFMLPLSPPPPHTHWLF